MIKLILQSRPPSRSYTLNQKFDSYVDAYLLESGSKGRSRLGFLRRLPREEEKEQQQQ